VRGIVTVAGKAVKLPDNHYFEQLFPRIANHLLESRTVVRLRGERTVNIRVQN
jgi:hypothetical protein